MLLYTEQHLLFVLSYFIPILFNVAQLLIFVLAILFILDFLIVFIGKNKIEATRVLPDKFSNGDKNQVKLDINNNYPIRVYLEIIDEIPEQFQVRDFKIKATITSRESKSITYHLKPLERGEYHFGSLNVYTSSIISLVAKRFTFNQGVMVPTYPSFKQLKKFKLLNINQNCCSRTEDLILMQLQF